METGLIITFTESFLRPRERFLRTVGWEHRWLSSRSHCTRFSNSKNSENVIIIPKLPSSSKPRILIVHITAYIDKLNISIYLFITCTKFWLGSDEVSPVGAELGVSIVVTALHNTAQQVQVALQRPTSSDCRTGAAPGYRSQVRDVTIRTFTD